MFFYSLLFLLSTVANGQTHLHPGGEFSSNDFSKQAFNHPVGNASFIEKQFFGVGNSFFKQAWVEFPSSTVGRDGLGPTYNAVSCSACHVNDGRGIGFINGRVNLSLLFRFSQMIDGRFEPHPDYGDQFQPLGITGTEGEGKVDVEFQYIEGRYPDGESFELRQPQFSFSNMKHSVLGEDDYFSPRIAPHLVGLGLIEAIDESSILENTDPFDRNRDGITGKANYVLDVQDGALKLGRFGWKAGQPSLRQQNAAAFIGDMGLTSSIFPQQNCPLIQLDCLEAPADEELEVTPKVLDRVTLYTQLIAVPKSRDVDSVDFKEGRITFEKIKCSSCHISAFRTGNSHPVESLRNQWIKPFSDFLLHDMGEGLADHRPEGFANGIEWRTPPLWSIGLIETVNRHSNFLHDGRARNVEEAILWHGGEAEASKIQFMELDKNKRNQVIKFINDI